MKPDFCQKFDFCPLFSGSGGNCVYLATGNSAVLIDAGLPGTKIEEALKGIGISPSSINGIFITHEHSDHIKGAGILCRRHGIPLFATAGTWEDMDARSALGRVSGEQRFIVPENRPFEFRDLTVVPFTIPHDAANPVGYSFIAGGRKATVATDIGHISETVREHIAGSEVLLIEANHDEQMLLEGTYPAYLKRRITGQTGHLSNVSCGEALAELSSSGIRHVFLGHLSEANNIPSLAYHTVEKILIRDGTSAAISLHVANRYSPSAFLRLGTP
ncbi:MAG: MBL fold metallo-hydrolase [Spirochaetaceae bacterium]|nr:MBL fold metallo-hydrolase [Spirochaetaceae bacterium]